jgi:formylglycine-generating enzyme required for sulfatase activity
MAVLAAGVLGGACVTQAAGAQPLVIETVPVGNPGNAADIQSNGTFGAVDYEFSIGRHEVTAGQYTAFLNAVAATDAEGLYYTRMDYDADPSREGCNIKRHGDPGSYTYSVAPDWAMRPVNYVSWADAARFANWLHNGQPTGAQDLTTTEDGSYFLDGISEIDDEGLEDVVREPDATWVIPSEDEWYKAAYHKNDGVTGNYWNFPTSADSPVSHELIDPDPGNNATFSGGTVGDWTIGAPYYRTEAGAHENSASPYGSFDQGGNVMEFTEAVPQPDIRRIRGGSWFWGGLLAANEVDDVMHSSDQFNDLGFRVVTLSEPNPPDPVPALSAPGLLLLLLVLALAGTFVLRPRRGSGDLGGSRPMHRGVVLCWRALQTRSDAPRSS